MCSSDLALPNGDILVVEVQGPSFDPVTRPKNPIVSWVQKFATGGGGSEKTGPTNRITLLRDVDGDGVPELRTVLLENLSSPFGVAFADNMLYVAATDAILRYPFTLGQTRITAPATVLTELPGGPIALHCQVGQRGFTAARLLSQLGHDVANLDGGYRTWRDGQATRGHETEPA